MTHALTCTGIGVRFGDFRALTDISLNFPTGRVTALIGPNGAGKTTLLNVLSGIQPADSGRIAFHGRDVTRLPPHRRAALGIARSFQIVTIFPDMTVLENVCFARQRKHLKVALPWQLVHRMAGSRRDAMEVLDRFGLADLADAQAATLSHGKQRALELAIVVVNDPQLLLLDEPLAGVGHSEMTEFAALIGEATEGRTVILVEHNMDMVMGISDQIVVLLGGAVLARGTPAEIRTDPRVRDAYLGE